MRYTTETLEEREGVSVEELAGVRGRGVTWVHVTGVHDVEFIARLCDTFGLHPLVREDIANTEQRPKLEDYGEYVYLVVKLLHDGGGAPETKADEARERSAKAASVTNTDAGGGAKPGTAAGTTSEQVSLILGPDFVLSFEEAEPSAFEAVRDRIRHARGPLRAQGADYLAYSLLDAVVDNYFVVLERFGERIEALQEELITRSARNSRRAEFTLHGLRREMVLLRRNVWPLREVIGTLERGGSALFRRETWVYLRDVYDHVIHMIDTLESFHEILTYTLDIYLLNATNRLNEIIKVLTVIATLFIPPTLIASIYGMNFRYMPELGWLWGYPLALALMLGAVAGMLVYFQRKKWF
jgi:magnesium transporter